MFRSIIVPLDGSEFGEYAIPYAISLSRRTGGIVKLVHVHQRDVPMTVRPLPSYELPHVTTALEAADAEARLRTSNRLWGLATRIAEQGVASTADVLTGRVPEAIAAFAQNEDGAIIVMTTHGRSGPRRLWLGSVADAVVRQSRVPVLLVRPTADAPPDPESISLSRILVPVDGSEFARAIVGPLEEFSTIGPVRLTFFQVTPPPDDVDTIIAPVWSRGGKLGAHVEADGSLRELKENLPSNLAPADVKRVIHLYPALAILQEADVGNYDLIAMTTHGRGSARHFLLGSTADMVLRGTEKPVLLFRPPGVERAAASSRMDELVERLVAPESVLSE